MGARKQRATTSETYAMGFDYSKVLTKAKRLHKSDGEFYNQILNLLQSLLVAERSVI